MIVLHIYLYLFCLLTLTIALFHFIHLFSFFLKMMNNIIIQLCFVLLAFQLSSAKWMKPRRLNVVSRPQNHIRDDRCRQFKTFTQKVDHFGFSNMDTYEERYTLNTDTWEAGRPIFFYSGNEGLIKNSKRKKYIRFILGDIDLFCDNTGFSKFIDLVCWGLY
jgi:hypothetical protein